MKSEAVQINLDSLDDELEAYDVDIEASEVVVEGRLDRLDEIDKERRLLDWGK